MKKNFYLILDQIIWWKNKKAKLLMALFKVINNSNKMGWDIYIYIYIFIYIYSRL